MNTANSVVLSNTSRLADSAALVDPLQSKWPPMMWLNTTVFFTLV